MRGPVDEDDRVRGGGCVLGDLVLDVVDVHATYEDVTRRRVS